MEFPSEEASPSIFFQDSLGPIDSDDGSGEDYRGNLEKIFINQEETTVWLTCVDCADTAAELQPYVDKIKPTFVFAMHFDGLMPDVSTGLEQSFQEPEWYLQLLADNSVVELRQLNILSNFKLYRVNCSKDPLKISDLLGWYRLYFNLIIVEVYLELLRLV